MSMFKSLEAFWMTLMSFQKFKVTDSQTVVYNNLQRNDLDE